tara:strand:- start:1496 stop:2056 length:561 start_codon:yes stop_codon:yes gene_type:complete
MATQISTETKIYKKQLRLYKKSLRTQLLTSRFTTETSVENELYRKKYKMSGCVYCSPDPISKTILPDSNMFILEMNNDTNKIIGIGLIKNRPISSKLRVYNNGNYNRYVYIGKYRISRDEMTSEEQLVMKIFDILCFHGNKHMKRGQGLKSFPVELLFKLSKELDLINYIGKMFKSRLLQIENENN